MEMHFNPWNFTNTAGKIAIARVLSRTLVFVRACIGQRGLSVAKRRGVWFELDLEEGIDLSIFMLGVFEPDTYRALERLIHRGDTVLDIGANVGAHTLHMARFVGQEGRVIAFEPTEYAMRKLRRNLQLNPQLAERVTTVRAYLTERGDAASPPPAFYSSWRLTPEGDQHPKHFGSLKDADGAQAFAFDDYVARAHLTIVDVIKIDVDGFEMKVLLGAEKTISEMQPVIIMELCPYVLEEHGATAAGLLKHLSRFGYQFLDERTLEPYGESLEDIVHHIKDGGGINVVAAPAGRAALLTMRQWDHVRR
jgi:FkbM family methyltransferase